MALRLTVEGKPDLVVVDLDLPGLGGMEVLEGIRATGLPIIVVTKSFDLAELLARIHGSIS